MADSENKSTYLLHVFSAKMDHLENKISVLNRKLNRARLTKTMAEHKVSDITSSIKTKESQLNVLKDTLKEKTHGLEFKKEALESESKLKQHLEVQFHEFETESQEIKKNNSVGMKVRPMVCEDMVNKLKEVYKKITGVDMNTNSVDPTTDSVKGFETLPTDSTQSLTILTKKQILGMELEEEEDFLM